MADFPRVSVTEEFVMRYSMKSKIKLLVQMRIVHTQQVSVGLKIPLGETRTNTLSNQCYLFLIQRE